MATVTVGYDAAGNALNYTTIAAAYAAVNEMDTLAIYYSGTNKQRTFREQITDTGTGATTKAVSMVGMLPGRQVTILFQNRFYNIAKNCNGLSGNVTFQNLRFVSWLLTSSFSYSECLYFSDTGTNRAVNFIVDSCEFIACAYAVKMYQIWNRGYVQNCVFRDCRVAFYSPDPTGVHRVYLKNNVIARCYIGINLAANNSVYMRNCAVLDCVPTYYVYSLSGSNKDIQYCVFGDTSGATYGTNCYDNYNVQQCGFLIDESNAGYPQDFRASKGAWLLGKGVDCGLTTDIDGIAYGGSFPIGVSTGINLKDSDVVLKSGGGNYDDDNLSVGNVRPVAFGLSQTGTLANLDATDGAYVALENSRNNDNGTVAGDIAVGKSVKIRNVTTSGTSDKVLSLAEEAARNTDPGIANVKVDTDYKIQNEDLTGTYDPVASPPTLPTLTIADDGTGSTATATIAAGDETSENTLYVRPLSGETWVEVDTLTGNGEIAISGLSRIQYICRVDAEGPGGTITAISKPFWITSGGGILERIRDRAAKAALLAIQKSNLGKQISFANPGDDAVTVWATINSGPLQIGIEVGGQTDKQAVLVSIPRQTGFPPAEFKAGATLTYQSQKFSIQTVTPQGGDWNLAAIYDCDCICYGSFPEVN